MNSNNLCGGAKSNGIANGVYPGSFDNCGTPHVSYSVEDLTKRIPAYFVLVAKQEQEEVQQEEKEQV